MPSKDEEARYLAGRHYEIEMGLSEVFRVIGPGDAELQASEPIKLLEVNEGTISTGILPIGFGPSPASGLHHSTIIVEVTPEEYQRIRSNELPLPHGWTIGDLIPRPTYTYEPAQ